MLAIFLDQETTGLDFTKHRTIDIAFKIVDVSSDREIASYEALIKLPQEEWDRHDPMSLQVNGFSYSDLADGKEAARVSREIQQIFLKHGIKRGKAVFICQNPSFDRSFFTHLVPVDIQERMNLPYHWLDLASMYWGARMMKGKKSGEPPFPEEIILSKDEIARFYGLPPEAKPHKAINGVNHLIQCYRALFSVGV